MSWRVLKYMEMNCLVGSYSLRTEYLTNWETVDSLEFARKKARNHSILIGVSHYNQHSHFLNTNADSHTSNPKFQQSLMDSENSRKISRFRCFSLNLATSMFTTHINSINILQRIYSKISVKTDQFGAKFVQVLRCNDITMNINQCYQ